MYTPKFIITDEKEQYIYASAGYGMSGMQRIVKLDLNLNVIGESKDNLSTYDYACIKGSNLVTVSKAGEVRCYNLSNNYSLTGNYAIKSLDNTSSVTSELNTCGTCDGNYIYLKRGGYLVRVSVSDYKTYEEILIPYEAYMFEVSNDVISYCTTSKYAQYKIKSI